MLHSTNEINHSLIRLTPRCPIYIITSIILTSYIEQNKYTPCRVCSNILSMLSVACMKPHSIVTGNGRVSKVSNSTTGTMPSSSCMYPSHDKQKETAVHHFINIHHAQEPKVLISHVLTVHAHILDSASQETRYSLSSLAWKISSQMMSSTESPNSTKHIWTISNPKPRSFITFGAPLERIYVDLHFFPCTHS